MATLPLRATRVPGAGALPFSAWFAEPGCVEPGCIVEFDPMPALAPFWFIAPVVAEPEPDADAPDVAPEVEPIGPVGTLADEGASP